MTYRGIKREFCLSDADVKHIAAELIEAEGVVRDEGGEVLVWLGAEIVVNPTPSPRPIFIVCWLRTHFHGRMRNPAPATTSVNSTTTTKTLSGIRSRIFFPT